VRIGETLKTAEVNQCWSVLWWLVWVSGGRQWVRRSSKATNAACLAVFDLGTDSALSRQPESAKKKKKKPYGPM
jgi:hypothetical protein